MGESENTVMTRIEWRGEVGLLVGEELKGRSLNVYEV